MDTPEVRPVSHELEMRLGTLLRAGVTLAAFVVMVGAIVYLSRHGHETPAYRDFQSEPAELRSVVAILAGSTKLHGRGIIQLGLLLLIATPIARVAFAAYGFARQRDWMYVTISTLVLLLLLYGLFLSKD